MSRRRIAAGAVIIAVIASGPAWGRRASAQAAAEPGDTLAPGVVHRRIVRPEGPWDIHVIEVSLRRPELSVESVHALDTRAGLERTSAMAGRVSSSCATVLAAVNADFFDLRHRSGETENSQVRRGDVLRGVPITESPFDAFDNVHSQLAITTARRPYIERFVFDGAWLTRWGPVRLDAVNADLDRDALVLFTPFWGDSTPRDTLGRTAAEVTLRLAGRRGDTAVYRPTSSVLRGGAAIPRDGAVLRGSGALAAAVESIVRSREPVRLALSFAPDRGRLVTLVGGWPRLLRGGVSVADSADALEGTFARFSAQRHPRTAVGFSRDSATLYLVTVDGRSENSGGMTLSELASLMRSLGASEALNLDGGGSTTMVVRGRLANVPSDSAGERTVGNGLMVVRRSRAGCAGQCSSPSSSSTFMWPTIPSSACGSHWK